MPRRVIIQGGSASPFRVSANDAASDDTFALIFDGNQSPLRILTHGWVTAARSGDNIAPAAFTQAAGPAYDVSIPGFPLFSCSGYMPPTSSLPARAANPYSQNKAPPPPFSGFGGALSGGYFYGINFFGGPYSVNFMIFRNRGN
jgi:hypothetical protein